MALCVQKRSQIPTGTNKVFCELILRAERALVLRRLFQPNSVPHSKVKFTWIKEDVDEA